MFFKTKVIPKILSAAMLISTVPIISVQAAEDKDARANLAWDDYGQYITWSDDSNYSETVTVGKDVNFWRYINGDNPGQKALYWKSEFGYLSDDDVNAWFDNKTGYSAEPIYFTIYNSELPADVREKVNAGESWKVNLDFSIDSTQIGRNVDGTEVKAKELFQTSASGGALTQYLWDNDGNLVIRAYPLYKVNESGEKIPYQNNGIYVNLPRAQYPYSNVLFSMWGLTAGNQEHYGALKVVEHEDPEYVAGESFSYEDILQNGTITANKTYPNYEAGKINEEGDWYGKTMADTLDSNVMRIGQAKSKSVWYFSYGGAVGYSFHFPIKVGFSVNDKPTITTHYIDVATKEEISTWGQTITYADSSSTVDFTFADDAGQLLVPGKFLDDGIYYNRFQLVDAATGAIEDFGDYESLSIKPTGNKNLNIYFVDGTKDVPLELPVKYIDKTSETTIAEYVGTGTIPKGKKNGDVSWLITDWTGYSYVGYEVKDGNGNIINTGGENDSRTVVVPFTPKAMDKELIVYYEPDNGTPSGSYTPTPASNPTPSDSGTPTSVEVIYEDADTGDVITNDTVDGDTIPDGGKETSVTVTIDDISGYDIESYTVELSDGTIENSYGSTDTRKPTIKLTTTNPDKVLRVKVKDTIEIESDCYNGTITWTESDKHTNTYYCKNGYSHTGNCTHKIEYRATLTVDSVTIHGNDIDNFKSGNVNIFHSGYGFDFWKNGWYLTSGEETDHLTGHITVEIVSETHSSKYCNNTSKYTDAHRKSTKASSIALPSVRADVGYTTTGFDSFSDVTQPQIIYFEVGNKSGTNVSSGKTVYEITFTATIPKSNLVDESKVDSKYVRRIYTPVNLSDGEHSMTVQFNGGGLDSVGFCKNFVYTYTIEGSMYDNDYTYNYYEIPEAVVW